MPFEGNASEAPVVQGRKLWTGLANWQVVALNPTETEREKLGITQNIQDYSGEDGSEHKQTRLDFWLKLRKIPYRAENLNIEAVKGLRIQKLSLFLTDVKVESTENKLWINRQGLATWAESAEAIADNPKMKWYDTTEARQILRGEEQLTNFLIALLNVDTRAEGVVSRLGDPSKIAKGNIKEVKDIINNWKDNTVQCLLGVNSTDRGKFQDFFKDFFGRTTPGLNTIEAWQKAIKDPRKGLAADWYRNFEIQDLKFSEYETSTEVGSEGFGGSPNYAPPPPSGGEPEDDLPF